MPTGNNFDGSGRSHSNAETKQESHWPCRDDVQLCDVDAIRRLVAETEFFSPAEIDIAAELVQERLDKGPASGYEFLIVSDGDELLGYTCYGEIPCTVGSFDIYWIAVAPQAQGRGLGRWLMNETERRIALRQGRHVYAETSSRPQYSSTRSFYEKCGYVLASQLDDFYAPGDGRATYRKILS